MLSHAHKLQFSKQSIRRLSIVAKPNVNNEELSLLSVKVRAGSRFASKDGVSHLLSRFNFQNTNNKSALRLVRESELLGGRFESTVDREFITLKAAFLKADLPYYLEAIGNVLYKTSFKPHELVETVLPAAHHDLTLNNIHPINKAEDSLYNLTFRSGLGNPVYFDGVEKISLDELKDFANKVYTKENIIIEAEGIEENDLKKFVTESVINSLPAGSQLKAENQSIHTGQTSRLRHVGESVAAIAIPLKLDELPTFQVLKNYLSTDVSGLSDLITTIKLDAYSDVALFSLYVKGHDTIKVGSDIKKIISELKKGINISSAKSFTELQASLQSATVDVSKVKDFKLTNFNYSAVGDVTKLPYYNEL
ncbi:hypothetical protein TPHA_0G00220 [Tetrapisispora phaffii CBS 4417]|uniref:Cytochrome b-c1 complex subunit 2, mitochondrial n=1 Tax=Tetrapisispora phaffii (strain ATCC 24235 / CBS 4417 / NBRC 1672 / NRRL Y-8282 / UCD 70-5) TaxID=1071381 RepID=G8BVD2_TETPH|nr:hypothetical protein TPHA_0G00220 [Tetrapisispora phaffii CBS 4417]CCE63860.1 hypothetical protein TPHA_0G00220 [Tetrapisispora phaffii CBS 4417]